MVGSRDVYEDVISGERPSGPPHYLDIFVVHPPFHSPKSIYPDQLSWTQRGGDVVAEFPDYHAFESVRAVVWAIELDINGCGGRGLGGKGGHGRRSSGVSVARVNGWWGVRVGG